MIFYRAANELLQAVYRGRSQLWHVVSLRKARECYWCNNEIAVGEQAYAPITHQDNRMRRIHVQCAERMIKRVDTRTVRE
jgi:hypothetical protein